MPPRLVKAAVLAAPFILFSFALSLYKERIQNGMVLGIIGFVVTAAVENVFILKAITRMNCPQCNQTLKRNFNEDSFKCDLCKTEWLLPRD